MILELSIDNILTIIGGGCIVVSSALGFGIRIVFNQNGALKKELDDLSDSLQDTRETYVTKSEFKDTTNTMMAKLDRITELLSKKPDRDFCDIKHARLKEGNK